MLKCDEPKNNLVIKGANHQKSHEQAFSMVIFRHIFWKRNNQSALIDDKDEAIREQLVNQIDNSNG